MPSNQSPDEADRLRAQVSAHADALLRYLAEHVDAWLLEGSAERLGATGARC